MSTKSTEHDDMLNDSTSRTDIPAVAIETHGCKLNQADSNTLATRFVEAGFRVVSTEERADVYVLNSCTVTHVADRKARQALRSARRRNPDATIVATGCYAQASPQVLKTMADVDLVAGNFDKHTLVQQVIGWRGESLVPCTAGTESVGFSPKVLRTRATIKIQEGCDQVCAYCIVPRVRGRERSISPETIIEQINDHVAHGYKEVVLTGTQLGSYGFDLTGITLKGLLERILDQTSVPRLRVSSLQPQEITSDFLALWSDERLCPHFHLPLQSGSDSVLRRMRRRYSSTRYADTVEMISDTIPGASVTADVIVGFPGESDANFDETRALCERMRFASMHVFPYSIRPGTSAAHFGDQVSPAVKSARMSILLALAESATGEFRERLLGQTRKVLWEELKEIDGDGMWLGLTDNYVRVATSCPNDLTNQITSASMRKRVGEMVYADALPG